MSKSKVQKFVKQWGQTTEEVCTNLDYDVEDSDDLLVVDYFYYEPNDVWIPKINSLYTIEDEKIVDELRN